MKEHARTLRKNQTDTEIKLWYRLRNRKLLGFKFRRQYCISPYIVDFICLEKKLIVELDGGQHQIQMNYDSTRTQFLNKKGFTVLRFWNNDVFQNMDSVLDVISKKLLSE